MARLFAVLRSRGPAWRADRPLEEQADWSGHAAFMNALHRDGVVLLGGPLDGTPDVLLITRADGEDEIRARLTEDPWSRDGLLRLTQITPWTLRLGALSAGSRLTFRHSPPPECRGQMSECKT